MAWGRESWERRWFSIERVWGSRRALEEAGIEGMVREGFFEEMVLAVLVEEEGEEEDERGGRDSIVGMSKYVRARSNATS